VERKGVKANFGLSLPWDLAADKRNELSGHSPLQNRSNLQAGRGSRAQIPANFSDPAGQGGRARLKDQGRLNN
jgi:hypothetical protein